MSIVFKLAEPLWTDLWLKSEIGACKRISTRGGEREREREREKERERERERERA